MDARDISNMLHVNAYPTHHFLGLLVIIAELGNTFSPRAPSYLQECTLNT
jgi:hypothetical protein